MCNSWRSIAVSFESIDFDIGLPSQEEKNDDWGNQDEKNMVGNIASHGDADDESG